MIELRLPIPPSVNAMYRNVPKRGRVKTGAYITWLKLADAHFLEQKRGITPVSGPCEIAIKLPRCRGDISNRIKAAEDYLVSRGITGDDRHNRKVSIERDESLTLCVVTIKSLEGENGAGNNI